MKLLICLMLLGILVMGLPEARSEIYRHWKAKRYVLSIFVTLGTLALTGVVALGLYGTLSGCDGYGVYQDCGLPDFITFWF